MRRAERLFEIVHHLRGRPLTTAAQLAKWLAVSERTVYRDVADLVLSGVPIDGAAGVGYRLRKDFDLPPLMFDRHEIEALVIGARMVESFGGPGLAKGARSALAKVAAIIPGDRRAKLESTRLYSPAYALDPATGVQMDLLRHAIDHRRKVRLDYSDAADRSSDRIVRPLGLFFWGQVWTLAAWCEHRSDFRNFRLDRICASSTLDETFAEAPGQRLVDYLRAAEHDEPGNARARDRGSPR